MGWQSYERPFGAELSPTPTIDVSALASATQVCLLMQGIAVLAASAFDVSLENDRTKNSIKLLTTPRSLKASLYQMGTELEGSFRIAKQAMRSIKFDLDDIPGSMTEITTKYLEPVNKNSTFIINIEMDTIRERLKTCSVKTAKTSQSFDNTMPLIEEMIQVTRKGLPKEMQKYQKIMTIIEQHWSILSKFFSTLERFVTGPMTICLESFDNSVKAKPPRNTGDLRDQVYSSGLKCADVYYTLSRTATTYNRISEKYLEPLIAEFNNRLLTSQEEAKREQKGLESKMQQITEESSEFLGQCLQEAEKETENMRRSFRDKLKAVLMPSSR